MSDELGGTPEDPAESFKDFLSKALGDNAGGFFENLEPDPMTEAWIGFHEFYKGLLAGGFPRADAIDITAAYLYRITTAIGGE
jgi:hypothetical protein